MEFATIEFEFEFLCAEALQALAAMATGKGHTCTTRPAVLGGGQLSEIGKYGNRNSD